MEAGQERNLREGNGVEDVNEINEVKEVKEKKPRAADDERRGKPGRGAE